LNIISFIRLFLSPSFKLKYLINTAEQCRRTIDAKEDQKSMTRKNLVGQPVSQTMGSTAGQDPLRLGLLALLRLGLLAAVLGLLVAGQEDRPRKELPLKISSAVVALVLLAQVPSPR
jgi:hypothetical protein